MANSLSRVVGTSGKRLTIWVKWTFKVVPSQNSNTYWIHAIWEGCTRLLTYTTKWFFAHPFCYIKNCSFSISFPLDKTWSGVNKQALSPPPPLRYTPSSCFAGIFELRPPLVDSHRYCAYPRRYYGAFSCSSLCLFLFLQLTSKVRPTRCYTRYIYIYTWVIGVRLSLGKLLVNLFQVVKRIYTTNSLTNGVVDRPLVFGSWVRIPPSTIIYFFQTFPMSNLKWYPPRYPQEMNRLDIDTSVRISGRPAIPPFQGGRVL